MIADLPSLPTQQTLARNCDSTGFFGFDFIMTKIARNFRHTSKFLSKAMVKIAKIAKFFHCLRHSSIIFLI